MDKKIRLKMLCSFSSSKDLCDEWKVICENEYQWKNYEITWDDHEIDYYIIINFPRPGEYFVPSKAILFQMEPKCATRNWKKWRNPDPTQFLYVGTHDRGLNNVQVQFKKIPIHFPSTREDKAMIILSAKNKDPGHKKRINLLKNDKKGWIDIYGRQNYHALGNYKGVLPNDNKEDLFVKYKYSFQAENNSEYNYATEKIWESIVCENLCFYWGCPNLETYIDPKAFVRLDLDNIPGSLKIIEQAIKEDWWSQRIDIIRKMKDKILNELSFFPRIEKIIQNNHKS